MKRTPMKRTAWLRTTPVKQQGARPRAPRREQRDPDRLRAMPSVTTGAFRAPQAVVAAPAPAPKSAAKRNAHLRDMARGMPCLLRVPGVCTQDRATVVCCHSNLSIHGKAGARNADDHYSVWGCSACHAWLDQGSAPKAQKTAAFMAAHLAQVLEWRAIAFDTRSAPRDRAAAQWALDLLNAQPNQLAALDGQAQAAINSGVNHEL